MNKDIKNEILLEFREQFAFMLAPDFSWEKLNERPFVLEHKIEEFFSAALDRIAEEARKETREEDIAAVESYFVGLQSMRVRRNGKVSYEIVPTPDPITIQDSLIKVIRSLGRTPSEGETQT